MRRSSVLAIALAALAGACDDESTSGACEDASTSDVCEPTSDVCDESPVVKWENFGEGFLLANCQACHASTAAVRHGAPVDVVFDTPEDVARWSDRLLERAASEAPTMPPGGGTEPEEREMLRLWLECYPP